MLEISVRTSQGTLRLQCKEQPVSFRVLSFFILKIKGNITLPVGKIKK